MGKHSYLKTCATVGAFESPESSGSGDGNNSNNNDGGSRVLRNSGGDILRDHYLCDGSSGGDNTTIPTVVVWSWEGLLDTIACRLFWNQSSLFGLRESHTSFRL
ncbi:unnamed protein product [Camellia sinensis]